MNSYQNFGTLFETKNGVEPAAISEHGTLIDRRCYNTFVNCFIKKNCKI